MNPLVNKTLIYIAGLFIFFLLGVFVEHERLVSYKGFVAGEYTAQKTITDTENAKNESNANATEGNYVAAITALDEYYKQHPVVVKQTSINTCSLPKTINSSQGTNGTTNTTNVGQYPDQDVEGVALRLTTLQHLLIDDGVTIK